MSFPTLARSRIALGIPCFRHCSSKFQRAASTKLPKGFVPPAAEDLVELRERVQEFTRKCASSDHLIILILSLGREIPEELAVKTDRDNEFPKHMWKKLGTAG